MKNVYAFTVHYIIDEETYEVVCKVDGFLNCGTEEFVQKVAEAQILVNLSEYDADDIAEYVGEECKTEALKIVSSIEAMTHRVRFAPETKGVCCVKTENLTREELQTLIDLKKEEGILPSFLKESMI